MKKINKKIFVLIIFTIFIFILSNSAFAESGTGLVNKFKGTNSPTGTDDVKEILQNGLSVVRIVGAGIAILILTVIGIKYMIASAGDRADIKKHAVPYVIGAVVMVAASGIIEIMYNFVNEITK